MQCPACNRHLTSTQAGSITVDVCVGGCGGMWFDQLELVRLDEEREHTGHALLDVDVDQTVVVDQTGKRNCPKCPDVVMMRSFYSPHQQVAVDHCGNCGGHWLDAGELRQIHSLYSSPEERQAHIDRLINDQFGDELSAVKERHDEGTEKNLIVGKLFGFLVPD